MAINRACALYVKASSAHIVMPAQAGIDSWEGKPVCH